MRTRVRIGPFTFGRTGIRLSIWRKGSGFSIPIFNKKSRSFGKIKFGIFSIWFNGKSKKKRLNKKALENNFKEIRKSHKHAYKPWTSIEDEELVQLFRKGKSVKELSQIFGRTTGAIRSRINKLLM